MAESKIPPTFTPLTPFIRRAEELEHDSSHPKSKLIAYYCRQYAMEMGIKLRKNDRSNDATNYLLRLMDRLEGDKQKLPILTQDEGKKICEDFALEVSAKADDEDRAGCADRNTARAFYAAGTFFDILNQFGDVTEEILKKRQYCKYKAATILKAIKEGTAPTPGPPPSFSSTTPVGRPKPSALQAAGGDQGEGNDGSGRGECLICMDANRNAICVPCGHVAGCHLCLVRHVATVHKCPICRAPVQTVIKIYDC